jgi:hypothetical protein
MESAIATAMWPPSSGKIGNKLKTPTKILRLAMMSNNVPMRWFQFRSPLERVSH